MKLYSIEASTASRRLRLFAAAIACIKGFIQYGLYSSAKATLVFQIQAEVAPGRVPVLLPLFNEHIGLKKVRLAEDAWNSRNRDYDKIFMNPSGLSSSRSGNVAPMQLNTFAPN